MCIRDSRSTNEKFRHEIEKILDLIIPQYVDEDRLIELKASQITEEFDWTMILERLCGPTTELQPETKAISLSPTLWD